MPLPVILVHRAQAYPHAIPSRHGLELDVRLHHGEVVLSHGPVDYYAAAPLSLKAFLHAKIGFVYHACYAWHLKEDGIVDGLARTLNFYPEICERSFVFGSNYPTMRSAHQLGLRCAERLSDEERIATVGYVPDGRCIWLDRWNWDEPMTYSLNGVVEGDPDSARCAGLPGQHEIWAVSPELHVGHSPWTWLKHHWWIFFRLGVAGICTDHPAECEQAYGAWKAEEGHG